jgi:hypothetical protein
MRGVFGVGPAFPPRLLHLWIGKRQIGLRRLTLWLACVISLLAGSASSHDASYGGVFRSRDLGAAWLTGNAASSGTAQMVSTTPLPTLSVGNLHGNDPRPSKGQGG